ncbi:MAG: phosphoenolpyruvate synthase [Nanoarchaeota archaeon]|nr:phosphoenolpyruvate synthase [Nanoarchaeota archaeon]
MVNKKEGESSNSNQFVKWFSELSNKDVPIAGGKGASLAEMYNNKFPVPPGFMITAQAYQYFIDKSGLLEKIKHTLQNLNIEDTDSLNEATEKIRESIKGASMPKELADQILEAYDILDVDKQKINNAGYGALGILKTGHEPPFVAVRSSATTEDLADASFAGQQDTFLNVKGGRELIDKVKACFASLFTARATYYRQKKGFAHDKAYLAVVVQRMIDSEKSGVMFSQNPVKNDNTIIIEAVWGLGEGIVSGQIKPDHYAVGGNLENFDIKESQISEKKIAIVRNSSGNNETVKLNSERSKQQVLSNYEIKRLAQYGKELENHYQKPQDIEFAIERNVIYIVQSRPITTKASDKIHVDLKGEILLSGLGASPGVASGVVKIIHSMADLPKIKPGDVLVTTMTNPDMVVAMEKASAIVTDEGGLTSHASIVSREMGIPAVVGTGEATIKLKEGQVITIDGTAGKVYNGKAETHLAEILPIVPTKTKIKVIVDLPDYAERAAKSHAKGVGLVRLEGIIASSGKHPLKFVKEKNMEDYVNILVNGLKKIVAPFEEIWVRSSDIRSDEYRNLEGAVKEVEGNPMLGDHGIRFTLKYPEILKAELKAVKSIAHLNPSKKIGFMVPQVIELEELQATKSFASQIQMPSNIKIGIMVETPAAVQIIESLCQEGIDFISFGTNDLTQYTLALDRNNKDVQHLYNEMNPAVLSSIAHVIKVCKKYNVETSICGQAASREEMARFLITQGISSLSVNADAAFKISELVAKLESSPIQVENIVENPIEKEVLKEEMIEVPMHEPIAVTAFKTETTDIEELALQELGDEYMPGNVESSNEIPDLNDAIPIDSELLQQKEEKIEDPGLSQDKEWHGEANP